MTHDTNQPTSIQDAEVNSVRNAIEHRATWMYFLLQEARQRGLDWDDFAREAIRKTGALHGSRIQEQIGKDAGLVQFASVFAPGVTRKVFGMEVVRQDEQAFLLDFHYCPLVAAWKKLGATDKEIQQLCDIAMDGDRAIAASFTNIDFDLGETIAQGHSRCQVRFRQKSNS